MIFPALTVAIAISISPMVAQEPAEVVIRLRLPPETWYCLEWARVREGGIDQETQSCRLSRPEPTTFRWLRLEYGTYHFTLWVDEKAVAKVGEVRILPGVGRGL